jgi:predicted component of type VI protein secretion system
MSTTHVASGPLLVYEGSEGAQRFPVGREPLLVGRGTTADVRVGDLSMSARHCRIEPTDGGWKVVDLGSRNGTFVNDVLVQQRRLQDGDVVRLGRAVFRFMLSDREADQLAQLRALMAAVHRQRGSRACACSRSSSWTRLRATGSCSWWSAPTRSALHDGCRPS